LQGTLSSFKLIILHQIDESCEFYGLVTLGKDVFINYDYKRFKINKSFVKLLL